MSTGGEAVNASVCKTDTRGFNSRPVLQLSTAWSPREAECNRPLEFHKPNKRQCSQSCCALTCKITC